MMIAPAPKTLADLRQWHTAEAERANEACGYWTRLSPERVASIGEDFQRRMAGDHLKAAEFHIAAAKLIEV